MVDGFYDGTEGQFIAVLCRIFGYENQSPATCEEPSKEIGLLKADEELNIDGNLNRGDMTKYLVRSVTNDYYFGSQGFTGKFTTYNEVTWQPVTGASTTWQPLLSFQKDYLLSTRFYDEEFLPSGSITQPSLLKEFLSDNTNRAYIQVAPGLWRSASVKLVYNSTNWNTITW